MAWPFKPAAAFRTPSMTGANPSSSAPFPHGDERLLLWRCAEQRDLGIDLVKVAHDRGNLADRSAVIEHEGRDNRAGIDGSIDIRKLFFRAEIDGRQFDVEILFGDQDSHAAGIGRAAGMIEFQGSSPLRFRVQDPGRRPLGWSPGLRPSWPG